MHVISGEETGKRIERPSRKSKRTSLLLTVLSLAIGVVLGIVVSRYAKPRAELLVGVMLAAITGCIVGFWLGRARQRGGKAERLFMLAMQEENQGKKVRGGSASPASSSLLPSWASLVRECSR